MVRSTEGFTIVEVLLAVLLLSLIVLVVLSSLGGFFSLSRQTVNQVDATNQAQAVIEEFKGQWQDSTTTAYAKSCLKVAQAGVALNNATVKIMDEDSAGNAINSNSYSPVYATDCTSANAASGSTDSALRRITVTMSRTVNNAGKTVLVTEIAAP